VQEAAPFDAGQYAAVMGLLTGHRHSRLADGAVWNVVENAVMASPAG
jgi:hypothetical protein